MRQISRLFLLLSLWLAGAYALAQDRIALVVGNASYEKASVLDNTTNDATDMAAALKTLGFEVLLHQNIRTRGEFRDVVRQFREALARGKDSIGVFFYAGHAVQVNGENYLIPTAADLRDIPDLDIETLSLGYVTAMAGDAGNPVNFFLIDACRDNPFRGFSRSLNRGLAVTDTPEGSVIVYAASPGRVASDGSGRNSPFTKNLLREIQSSEHVLLMLQNVVKGVRQDTGGQQLPWFHTSLTGDFYFNPSSPESTSELPVEIAAAAPATSAAKSSADSQNSATVSRVPQSVPVESEPQPEAAVPAETAVAAIKSPPVSTVGQPLSGRWQGRLRNGAGPGAAVTLEFQVGANGGYKVAVSRLISYGEVPASCTFASGRLSPSASGALLLELTHAGCRGAGELRLTGDNLSGNLRMGDDDVVVELSRR